MTLIHKNELKEIFVSIMSKEGEFEFEEGGPFMITFLGRQFFVYVKNITSAYFKNLPDITRVQLPFRPHYNRILDGNIPFIIIGYDRENEIFVNWNPSDIKRRLNSKSNVSLYSKKTLQSQVHDSSIKRVSNVNDDMLLMFKKEVLPDFFRNFESLYDGCQSSGYDSSVIKTDNNGLLSEIDDRELLEMIKPALSENKVLKAVEICSKHYNNRYPKMGFKDWYELVSGYMEK